MEISDQELQTALQRGEELRQNGYAVSAEYDALQNRLVVGLSSGMTIMVPVYLMQALAEADPAVLSEVEIAPSGLSLHWPSLDADVYVPSLMQGVFGTKRWMAAQLGAAGGSSAGKRGQGRTTPQAGVASMVPHSETLPPLTSDAEAEAFVDTADLTDYDLSDFSPMRFKIAPKTDPARTVGLDFDDGGSEDA